MVFWGESVGNERVAVEIPDGGSIYLLQVCLQTPPKSSAVVTSLYVQTNNAKKGFLICHLGASHPQFSLCHELVSEDSPFVMWTTGGTLDITGTMQAEEGSDDDDSHHDHEHSHDTLEECAPTVADQKKPAKRTRSIEESEVTAAPKKTKPAAPSGAEVAADVVIPQTQQHRKKWKIKPQNDEGVLVVDPKPLKKASGVAVTDYIIGKGAVPKLGAKIKITYEGSFPDGTIFDSRITRSKPFSFRLGTAQVIRGLDLGMEGMRIGGSREILIPPELG
jgi:FKBP-type peptidyl-prolyl cis-trans isomerase